MSQTQIDWVALVGRVLLALIFLLGGLGWAGNLAGPTAAAANAGVPLANIAVPLAMIIQIVGALMVIGGFYTRLGALGLLVFTFLALIFFHRFWEKADAAAAGDRIQFLKDLALCGGLMVVIAFGPGRLSVDARRGAQA
jgi:putative oxidoreductase